MYGPVYGPEYILYTGRKQLGFSTVSKYANKLIRICCQLVDYYHLAKHTNG